MDPQKSENEEKDFKSETNINISKYTENKITFNPSPTTPNITIYKDYPSHEIKEKKSCSLNKIICLIFAGIIIIGIII
jgi:hypothetical protein